MVAFLSEIQLVLPAIGIDLLRRPTSREEKRILPTSSSDNEKEQTFELRNQRAGIVATAREEFGEFIVDEGSIGSLKEALSFNDRNKAARDEAFETGRVEKVSQENFKLLEDIAFTSPSAASVFLFGTSRNGRTDWMVSNSGLTYGAWKDKKIDESLGRS